MLKLKLYARLLTFALFVPFSGAMVAIWNYFANALLPHSNRWEVSECQPIRLVKRRIRLGTVRMEVQKVQTKFGPGMT